MEQSIKIVVGIQGRIQGGTSGKCHPRWKK